MTERKLVTIRTIDAIEPIDGADAIEVVVIGGWKVVTKKNEFKAGEDCLYFEIDSFLPDGVPAWQFLVDKSSRMFEGRKGHKLRTIKLRGTTSQGFVLRLDAIPSVYAVCNGDPMPADLSDEQQDAYKELMVEMFQGMDEGESIQCQADFAKLLGIEKFEVELPACLQGQAAGLFPSFIPKTDQNRAQNVVAEIFGYDSVTVPFNVDGMESEVVNDLLNRGVIQAVHSHVGIEYVKVLPAKADRDTRYEVSMKLDGSSMTIFARYNDGTVESGVCSRNLQLKLNEENATNTFVSTATKTGLIIALEALALSGVELALQMELMGPGIQSNRENFKDFEVYVFDIFDIKNQRKLSPSERMIMVEILKTQYGCKFNHAPVPHASVTLDELGITNIQQLLAYADGPSINNKVREGWVFKRVDGQFSFKAISNKFLIGEK